MSREAELRAAIAKHKSQRSNSRRDLSTLMRAYNRCLDENKPFYRSRIEHLKELIGDVESRLSALEGEYADAGFVEPASQLKISPRVAKAGWKTRACPKCGAPPGWSCRPLRLLNVRDAGKARPHKERLAVAS